MEVQTKEWDVRILTTCMMGIVRGGLTLTLNVRGARETSGKQAWCVKWESFGMIQSPFLKLLGKSYIDCGGIITLASLYCKKRINIWNLVVCWLFWFASRLRCILGAIFFFLRMLDECVGGQELNTTQKLLIYSTLLKHCMQAKSDSLYACKDLYRLQAANSLLALNR